MFSGDLRNDDLTLDAFVGQVYDAIVEESWGRDVRPCPGHIHPSWPSVRDGELTWSCPLSDPLCPADAAPPGQCREASGEVRDHRWNRTLSPDRVGAHR